MKRAFRFAMRLYPSWWRHRYAREVEALLEDMKPGWSELFDVVRGALAMQMRTVGTIPVLCALAGAIIGGVIALRTPELFASSATIRLGTADIGATIRNAVAASGATKVDTLVTRARDASKNVVTVTYLDRDAARSQRIAEKLTAALTTENSNRDSAEVLEPPRLPSGPIKPDYPLHVASGGGVGLLAGAVALLVMRLRRQ